MRHLLVAVLLASCADSPSPEPEPPMPEPEMETPPEMPDPGTPTPTPTETPDGVIARWQQCMTFGDFQTANVASTWANMSTANNQKCTSCHVNGGWGFVATTNAQQMFDILKADKYYLLEFITLASSAQGGYQVIFNEQTIPAAGSGQAPYTEHPRFTATAGMNAARTFFNLTQARCSTPI
jgi:cytochrome c